MVPTPLRATMTFNIGRQQFSQNVGDVEGRLVDTFIQSRSFLATVVNWIVSKALQLPFGYVTFIAGVFSNFLL